MGTTSGRCLCGAVNVEVHGELGELTACHCDMCRRWSGSMQMGLKVLEDQVEVTGPVKVFQSSSFAERAWCETCGSSLWLRNTSGSDIGHFELAPGMFENAAGAMLVREVYADKCPEGYALAGEINRVSQVDYERANAFVRDGETG